MAPAPEERPDLVVSPQENLVGNPAASPVGDPAVSPAPVTVPVRRKGPGRGRGRRGTRLVRHSSIDETLSLDDRTAYEALLLDPRQTLKSLMAWLRGRGYDKLTRASVHRHRRSFQKDVMEIRKSAKIAGQFAALARASGGAGGLADASQFRLEQMFLERVFGMKGEDHLDGKQWTEFGKAMATLLDTRRRYETLRMEWQEKAARAAEAVEHAGAGTGRGGRKVVNGHAIANTVRILGIPLPGEPVPDYPGPDCPMLEGGTVEEMQRDETRSIEIANEVRRQLGAPPVGEPGEN